MANRQRAVGATHLGGGEKLCKGGKGSFGRRGFYSRRRERELVAGPYIGIDGRRRGSLVTAAVSGRARTSLDPESLTGRATVSLNRPALL
jgi:hypothetical protein